MNPAITTVLVRTAWGLSALTVLLALGWVGADTAGDPWPGMVLAFAVGGAVVALPGLLASLVAIGTETPRVRGIAALVAVTLAALPPVTFVALGQAYGF